MDAAGETLLNIGNDSKLVAIAIDDLKFCKLIHAKIGIGDVNKYFANRVRSSTQPTDLLIRISSVFYILEFYLRTTILEHYRLRDKRSRIENFATEISPTFFRSPGTRTMRFVNKY